MVIRNLLVSPDEVIKGKVNNLIKGTLKLENVIVNSAERKNSSRENVPGVVIATCKSHEDKEQLMKNKSKLKGNPNYEKVFIDHDKDRQTRIQEANWRSVVKAVGNNEALIMKGDRVLVKQTQGLQKNDRDQSGGQRQGRNLDGQANKKQRANQNPGPNNGRR